MEKVLNQILTELKNLNQRVGNVEEGQHRLDTKLDKLELRMENEVIEKVRGLYDFREVQLDTNRQIISTLDRLEAKVDVLQMETAHIRRIK